MSTTHVDDAEAQKIANFDALYALDDQDDDDERDEMLLDSLRQIKGKVIGDPTISISRRTPGTSLGNLTRSVSNINTALPLPLPSSTDQQLPRPRRAKNPRELLDEFDTSSSTVQDTPTLRHHHTVFGTSSRDNPLNKPAMPSSSAPPASSAIPMVKKKKGKGKEEAQIDMVPEDQRIFKDLHFYFFPNNDAGGRAMRIVKAMEFGASWQKEFDHHVTHIIIDQANTFEQLLKFLRMKELPANVVLVNENYPAACMAVHHLRDSSSPEFRVKGYKMPPPDLMTHPRPAQVQPGPSQESEVSLKLKPAKKPVVAASSQNTSQSEDSPALTSSGSRDYHRPAPFTAGKRKQPNDDESELDAAIREAKESHPLASDDEEDDDTSDQAIESRKKRKPNDWQDKFQCMHKHTGSNNGGPNAQTISVLQDLANHYEQTRDQWRLKSYRQAIAALRNHPTKVTTSKEASRIHNIGISIAEKIEEIVRTNRLQKLDYTKLDERQQILNKFMKIYGVGLNAAERWASAGHKTLEDLLQKVDLTANQRIGITHYDDFNTRIPRAEVEQHTAVVTKALKSLDPAYQINIMGSYRRGALDSGDIDLLITKPGASIDKIRTTVMDHLVPLLTERKFLVAALAQTSQSDGTKWHGASRLPNSRIWRRIDLLLVPEEELGAALLYFTGNDIFNRSLRLLASRKGMRLNQRGLYKDVLRDRGREKLSEGTLVEGRDEKRIFEALGVPWRPPEHRIC